MIPLLNCESTRIFFHVFTDNHAFRDHAGPVDNAAAQARGTSNPEWPGNKTAESMLQNEFTRT